MKRKNIRIARKLRNTETDAERILWSLIRSSQLENLKFRRQYSIGNYILDFYCAKHKLAIEADGREHRTKAGKAKDKVRAQELQKEGIRILRFNDNDILNHVETVCNCIVNNINTPSTQPSPPRVEGEYE